MNIANIVFINNYLEIREQVEGMVFLLFKTFIYFAQTRYIFQNDFVYTCTYIILEVSLFYCVIISVTTQVHCYTVTCHIAM